MPPIFVLLSAALAGPVVTDEFGGLANDDIADWSVRTNVVRVTNTSRLIAISPRLRYAPASGADLMYWVLYEETAPDTWDLVWDSGLRSSGATTDFKDSPLVDVELQAGVRYAMGWYMSDGNYEFWWEDPAQATTTGWGELEGAVWTAENTTYILPDQFPLAVDDQAFAMQLTVEILDVDGDGLSEDVDCNDDDPTIYPGAPELCDGLDNDCSGAADDPVISELWYEDGDLDGFGDPLAVHDLCDGSAPDPAWVQDSSDCSDADPAIHPDASEVCDTVDNDCDGLIDDADGSTDPATFSTWYADDDGDGFGRASSETQACGPDGWVVDATDCDDGDAARFPGNPEVCDGVDNDCDDVAEMEADSDGDGFLNCEDCRPGDASSYPGAPEWYDDIDHDCDGSTGPAADSPNADPDRDEELGATSGCGCAASGGLPVGALVLVPLLWRRRHPDRRERKTATSA